MGSVRTSEVIMLNDLQDIFQNKEGTVSQELKNGWSTGTGTSSTAHSTGTIAIYWAIGSNVWQTEGS